MLRSIQRTFNTLSLACRNKFGLPLDSRSATQTATAVVRDSTTVNNIPQQEIRVRSVTLSPDSVALDPYPQAGGVDLTLEQIIKGQTAATSSISSSPHIDPNLIIEHNGQQFLISRYDGFEIATQITETSFAAQTAELSTRVDGIIKSIRSLYSVNDITPSTVRLRVLLYVSDDTSNVKPIVKWSLAKPRTYDAALAVLSMHWRDCTDSALAHELGHVYDSPNHPLKPFGELFTTEYLSEAFADFTSYAIHDDPIIIERDGKVVRNIAMLPDKTPYDFINNAPRSQYHGDIDYHNGSLFYSNIFYCLAQKHGIPLTWGIFYRLRHQMVSLMRKVQIEPTRHVRSLGKYEKEKAYMKMLAINEVMRRFFAREYPEYYDEINTLLEQSPVIDEKAD